MDLYLLGLQLVLLFLVCLLGLEGQASLSLHAAPACRQFLFAQLFQLDQGDHLDQVVHLLLGPLYLLGHQEGQLVLDLLLVHETRGPHEDLEVLPSQAPLRAPQVLELQQDLEVQLCRQNQEIL